MASATTTPRSQRTSPGRGSRARLPLAARVRRDWGKLALGALCVLALVCFLAFPTYPTYDSLYALLWGRELLHLELPDIAVYRAPTEHPLAIAFGVLCSLFGAGGARLMVLGSIASFVALVVGAYRVGRACFGSLVGALAALLVLSRFFIENLALQGYLDVTYVALVVWAAALELERPRRGWPVLGLLCAAGLLRPEAWVLSGAYWLWCAWPHAANPRATAMSSSTRTAAGRGRALLAQAALAALAPLLWMGFDTLLSGDPLHSLRSTSGLAHRLGRTQDLAGVLSSTWSYLVRIDKLPILLGSLGGVLVAMRIVPSRSLSAMRMAPRGGLLLTSMTTCLMAAFVVEGLAGASVLDRYLIGAAVALLPFCALGLGGWSLLERGSRLRRAWMLAAGGLAVYGVLQVNATLSLSSLRDTLAYHEQLDQGLLAALHSPAVERSLGRCGVLSLPNNKLIPAARWILSSSSPVQVLARGQARELAAEGSPMLLRRLRAGSVAVYPLPSSRFFDAVAGVGEDPPPGTLPSGFEQVYTSRHYRVYANC